MCRRRSPGLVLLLLCCLAVPAVAEDAAGSGTLIVSVSQAGAAIILDGELRGDSPLDPIDGVPTGPHVLEVQLGGFSSATREFFLQAGETKEVRVFLEVQEGARLSIESITEGARVYIDEFEVGTVPLAAPVMVAPGTHEVKVTRLGFMPFSTTVKARKGRKEQVQADLLAFAGILDVRSSVESAEVELDGKSAGSTPLELEAFAGNHEIVVRKDGYRPFTQQLTVAAGVSYSINAQLEPLAPPLAPVAPPPVAAEVAPAEPADEVAAAEPETAAPAEGTAPLVETPPPPGRAPEDDGGAWYEQWWLWVTVGVVVAVAVAVPVALETTSDDGKTNVPDTDVPPITLP